MTTGSLCFTEILMSRKPCSSNSEASQSADSTSASGVALPYLASSRLSSEPAFTPIRIDTPASAAARAMAPTWSSKARMLPGFTRTPAQPASMAAKTYLGWKWMSAITGSWLFLAIADSASASSWLGQATRTMSQPAAVSWAICCRVALTSEVSVVVIDCTEIGASPPTATEPTLIWRDFLRGASTGGGAAGMPNATGTLTALLDPWFVLVGCPCDPARSAQVEQVHHEDQGLAALDGTARTALTVTQMRRDDELPPAADLHALHPLVPAGDHPAGAEREAERRVAVVAGVELLAGGVRDPDVMHDRLLPGLGDRPVALDQVTDLQF